jgi:transcription initiation factor TFIID TATA-box-binding protein
MQVHGDALPAHMGRRRRADQATDARFAHVSLMHYVDEFNARHESATKDSDAVMVHNVVGTSRLSMSIAPLDLHLVSMLLPNSSFTKKKFAAITIRLQAPVCTVLLFASGKMVLTGCQDFLGCIYATYHIMNLLRNNIHGVHFEIETIQMQNIVGHTDLHLTDQTLDLARFYADHNIDCTFQRTMFPGLIYRPLNSMVVMLIFKSGRLVLTGAKNLNALVAAWKRMRGVLLKYVIQADD